MNRRNFLRTVGAASTGCLFPRAEGQRAQTEPSGGWRTYQVETHVEVLQFSGTTRIRLPTTLLKTTPFQRTLSNEFTAPGGNAQGRSGQCRRAWDPYCGISSGRETGTHPNQPRDDAQLCSHFLRPTKLLPTDGIVKARAIEITRGAKTDLDKARAIYEWIVQNTSRNPKTRGCGIGDIRFMLESGDLTGKCADLNALYVGLARAAGLPARDLDGIPKRSTAGPKSTSAAMAGCPLTLQMCEKLCWRNRPEI